MKITFWKANDGEFLKDVLRDAEEITKEEFEELYPNYHLYSYDDRVVNRLVFLANDMVGMHYHWIWIAFEQ